MPLDLHVARHRAEATEVHENTPAVQRQGNQLEPDPTSRIL